MNIDEAIEFVEGHIDYLSWAARSARTGEVDLSLDRMQRFADVLGNPQRDFAVIHVTGTNGKGSTSRMISRILMAEGLRVGTYSSPHLARYNERFRLDDVDIADVALAELLSEMASAEEQLGERLMPFEVLTGAALQWFSQLRVDVAVLEVGVLGRYDATNVADGRVAVVTNIGFDHTNGVGDWQARIAHEKAGIVKPGAHLVLGGIDHRLDRAFEQQGPSITWRLGREIRIVADHAMPAGRQLSVEVPDQSFHDVTLPLLGAHQAANCALAIAAAAAFLARPLGDSAVRAGLAAVRMPARFEIVSTRPTVIVDGAHNPDAARALARVVHDELPRTGRRTLVVGLLGGRDPATMLAALDASRFDEVIACTPPTARARPASEIVAAARQLQLPVRAIEDIGDALRTVLDEASHDDQIVVTGSIYLVADAREWLGTRNPGGA